MAVRDEAVLKIRAEIDVDKPSFEKFHKEHQGMAYQDVKKLFEQHFKEQDRFQRKRLTALTDFQIAEANRVASHQRKLDEQDNKAKHKAAADAALLERIKNKANAEVEKQSEIRQTHRNQADLALRNATEAANAIKEQRDADHKHRLELQQEKHKNKISEINHKAYLRDRDREARQAVALEKQRTMNIRRREREDAAFLASLKARIKHTGTSVLRFSATLAKIGFVTIAGQATLFAASLVSINAALAIGRFSVSTYSFALRGLALSAAAAATAVGVAMGAYKQWQEAQLAPMLIQPGKASYSSRFGVAQNLAATRLSRSYSSSTAGLLGNQSLYKISAALAQAGMTSPGRSDAIARGLFNISGGDSAAAATLANALAKGDVGESLDALKGAKGINAQTLADGTWGTNGGILRSIATGELTGQGYSGLAGALSNTMVGRLKTEFAGLQYSLANLGEPLLPAAATSFSNIGSAIRGDLLGMRKSLQGYGEDSFLPYIEKTIVKTSEWFRTQILDNIQNITRFTESVSNFFESIHSGFRSFGDWLNEYKPAADIVGDMFRAMGTAAGGRSMFRGFADLVRQHGDKFEKFGSAVGYLFGSVLDLFAAGQGSFFGRLDNISATLSKVAHDFVPAIGNLMASMAPILALLPDAIGGLASVLSALAPILESLLRAVGGVGAMVQAAPFGSEITGLLLAGGLMATRRHRKMGGGMGSQHTGGSVFSRILNKRILDPETGEIFNQRRFYVKDVTGNAGRATGSAVGRSYRWAAGNLNRAMSARLDTLAARSGRGIGGMFTMFDSGLGRIVARDGRMSDMAARLRVANTRAFAGLTNYGMRGTEGAKMLHTNPIHANRRPQWRSSLGRFASHGDYLDDVLSVRQRMFPGAGARIQGGLSAISTGFRNAGNWLSYQGSRVSTGWNNAGLKMQAARGGQYQKFIPGKAAGAISGILIGGQFFADITGGRTLGSTFVDTSVQNPLTQGMNVGGLLGLLGPAMGVPLLGVGLGGATAMAGGIANAYSKGKMTFWNGLATAGGGAALGAAVGSVLPGIGTAIGAGIGAALGFTGGQIAAAFGDSRRKKRARSIAAELTTNTTGRIDSMDLLKRRHKLLEDANTAFESGRVSGKLGDDPVFRRWALRQGYDIDSIHMDELYRELERTGYRSRLGSRLNRTDTMVTTSLSKLAKVFDMTATKLMATMEKIGLDPAKGIGVREGARLYSFLNRIDLEKGTAPNFMSTTLGQVELRARATEAMTALANASSSGNLSIADIQTVRDAGSEWLVAKGVSPLMAGIAATADMFAKLNSSQYGHRFGTNKQRTQTRSTLFNVMDQEIKALSAATGIDESTLRKVVLTQQAGHGTYLNSNYLPNLAHLINTTAGFRQIVAGTSGMLLDDKLAYLRDHGPADVAGRLTNLDRMSLSQKNQVYTDILGDAGNLDALVLESTNTGNDKLDDVIEELRQIKARLGLTGVPRTVGAPDEGMVAAVASVVNYIEDQHMGDVEEALKALGYTVG